MAHSPNQILFQYAGVVRKNKAKLGNLLPHPGGLNFPLLAQ
jgi:hypothetical protein